MDSTSSPRTVRMYTLARFVLASVFISGCIWVSRDFVELSYEAQIGKRLVAKNTEPLVRYETGSEIGGEKDKILSRTLYYEGKKDSTILFFWQVYERTSLGGRSIENSSIVYSWSAIPFTMSVRGFLIQIHEADDQRVTYTVVKAEPTDLDRKAGE